jgi:hypothetical protein
VLTHLQLRDFVIVDSADLEFGAGLTALTGETGAGKSVVVDALATSSGTARNEPRQPPASAPCPPPRRSGSTASRLITTVRCWCGESSARTAAPVHT